jgi:hypothetical protein
MIEGFMGPCSLMNYSEYISGPGYCIPKKYFANILSKPQKSCVPCYILQLQPNSGKSLCPA